MFWLIGIAVVALAHTAPFPFLLDVTDRTVWRMPQRAPPTLYLTFDTPPADTFVLAYDAYIQPASQVGRSGTVAVVEDGRQVGSLDFQTTLLP